MSKELEALKVLKANAILFDDGTDCGASMLESIMELDNYFKHPTAEEVCEAISDYLDFDFLEIKCVFKDNGFHEESGGELLEVLIDYQNDIYFYVNLPPHIVEMVARFYKTLDKEIKTIHGEQTIKQSNEIMPLHGTPTNESRSIQDPIYHWIGTRPVYKVKCSYCQETKEVHRIYTAKQRDYCCFDHKMKGIRKYNDSGTLQSN